MERRRLLLGSSASLAATLALAACGGAGGPGGRSAGGWRGPQGAGGTALASRPANRVALLVPLSGPNANVGPALQRAATRGLGTGGPALDVRDTGGTPTGAASAAQAALEGGADLILGPLTSGETGAVAPVAAGRGIGVLAFTNDPAQAQPGVWPLGITPLQQVRRLMDAARNQGRTRVAALLPANDFGRAMGRALEVAAPASGVSVVRQVTYEGNFNAVNEAVRSVSGYASRRGPLDAQIRALRNRGDAAGRREAQQLARRSVPPPDFDILLLAEGGNRLREITSLLPYYDVESPSVRVMGPALWQAEAATLGRDGALVGGWFAAPDPGARAEFASAYQSAHGGDPPRIADIAFDAAAIARVAAGRGGYNVSSLTAPEGFAGAGGLVALLPDGEVRRGLALFEIERRGAQIVEPAPETLAAPGL